MSRPIWKGTISFGLVNIPVTLFSAERRATVNFKMIDSRNSARVRYERVNEETGEEVPWNSIVKGYEHDKGHYVLLSDEELENASVELTRIIEIEQFVDLTEIDPNYYDRPYYLVPGKSGHKGYVILREAMNVSGMVGISQVVIRSRQYLAAIRPVGEAIMLNLLRFEQELRDVDEHELPPTDLRKLKVTSKEVELASQLIEGMSAQWDPGQYHDDFHDAVMKLIQDKIDAGEFEARDVEAIEEEESEPVSVNMMEALKKSIESTKPKKKKKSKSTKSRGKKAG